MRTLHAILPAAVFGCLLTAPAAFAAGTGENTTLDPKAFSSTAKDTTSHTANSSGGLVRTIIGLAVVLGVIYGLYWVLKQVKSSKDTASAGEGLETLATLPLGAHKSLHLVRAGREIVLLGTAENAIAPIRRYSEAEARALGLIEGPPTVTVPMGATLASLEPAAAPKGFMNALRSKTVVK
ncbi:flagellar biosynthetic protein FliO [Solirubrobacter ginsenosidimutans]|uniref:Flagellar biosynthetic protein FliO n=1 Tax=Solirubrobacter ginsenosidimutans TaxID=490573 RepID=A0A9X3MYS6_9ACTN|nr:flagellar biosynthetic protein FliO [Solirubrobacter ginsenosidimutans]MDA0161948.1 flagellar biosynthetic protein FliO [Solirubrobacter ginsenosidimutans]